MVPRIHSRIGGISAMAPKFSDDPFAQAMANLRSHLKMCAACRLALDGRGWVGLCDTGAGLAVGVASKCESVLRLKRQAMMDPGGYVHACPDLSKHGEAYAMSAMPFSVRGTQEELF